MSMQDYLEKDYYAELGVTKNATTAEIKKAYRKLARDLHPDKNPGDTKAEERFKAVSEAYDVLSNDTRRKEYDEARNLMASGAFRGFPGGARGARPGGAGGFDFTDLFAGGGATADGGLGDLFGGLFGRRGGSTRRGRGRRGADLETSATLSFADAVGGTTISLRLMHRTTCDTCRGSGAAPGTSPKDCPVCRGSGLTTRNQGSFAFSEPCQHCRGTGTVVETPCPTCHGERTVDRPRTVTARIPAGVADGQRIRLAGKGESGLAGGEPGDLYVVIRVTPHPLFGRSGDNLTLKVPVTFPELVRGTTLTVPTMGSPVSLKVPAGTASGRKLRVRGRGVRRGQGRPGDLIVTVEVAIPTRLTPQAQQALDAFAAAQTDDPRPHITAAVAGQGDAAGRHRHAGAGEGGDQ